MIKPAAINRSNHQRGVLVEPLGNDVAVGQMYYLSFAEEWPAYLLYLHTYPRGTAIPSLLLAA
jgi:hypothetical protein